MTKYIIFAFLVLISVYFTEQAEYLSHDHIKKINDVAKTWTARQNFHPTTSIEFIKRLLGAKNDYKEGPVKNEDSLYVNDKNVPKSFDARKQWKNCQTIKNVPNQGYCGSCWAFAITSAFSDRLCVGTKGKFNELISAQELLSCCKSFGCFGCHGGIPIKAWKYLSTNGLVTGGGYQSFEGCQPYLIKPCVRDGKGNSSCANDKPEHSGKCQKSCYGDKTIDYKSDHHKTNYTYFLNSTNVQKDLLAYGSVAAGFTVYDDFPYYSSVFGMYTKKWTAFSFRSLNNDRVHIFSITDRYSEIVVCVYVKTDGAKSLGGHAVKLIGWGVEDDVPYWLCINSWGPEWGDKGTFKIQRGTNECDIENSLTAGLPLV